MYSVKQDSLCSSVVLNQLLVQYLCVETLCNVTCEKVSSPLVDYFIVHSVSVQVYQLVDTIIFLYITVHMYSIIYL